MGTTNNNETNIKKHKVTIFEQLNSSETGDSHELSLDEINNLLNEYACNAADLRSYDDERIREVKKSIAIPWVFAELKNGKRNNESFLGRTLLSIDIDHKDITTFSLEQAESLLIELGIDSIIYTTISHQEDSHRLRIIADAGVYCNEYQYKQFVEWFVRNIPDRSIVDTASFVVSQAMIVPCAYAVIPPRVVRIKGKSVNELYGSEVEGIVLPTQRAKLSKKINASTNKKVGTKAENLYLEHVNFLHGSLIKYASTSNSTQFFRNLNDNYAGLFSGNDMRFIYDRPNNKSYSTIYAKNDFEEALNHSLMPRSDVESAILKWEKNSDANYAVFRENCGSGKSQTLLRLTTYDPSYLQRIITFLTKANRDAFAQQASNSVVVYGNLELIEQVVTDNERRKKIKEYLNDYYENNGGDRLKYLSATNSDNNFIKRVANEKVEKLENKSYFHSVLKECMGNGLLSDNDVKKIMSKVRKNAALLKRKKHLIMTTMKFEILVSFAQEDAYSDFVVYTDEVHQGMLTNIPVDMSYQIYKRNNGKCATGKVNQTTVINHERLKKLKRCLITVEEGICYELDKQQVLYESISEPVKTYDPNLEILLVKSTSNHYKEYRSKIVSAVRQSLGSSATIIADGQKHIKVPLPRD